jgi:hypothetical protein
VDRIRNQLRIAGCESVKTNLHGEPDIFACCPFGEHGEGIFIAIEVKRPGNSPDPIQHAKLSRWTRSGAVAFWTDRAEAIVDRIMNELQQRKVSEFLPLT